MKKGVKIAVGVVGAAVAVSIAYQLCNRVPDSSLSQQAQVSQILQDGGCLSCHCKNPQLPVYASWPVVGSMVHKDVATGCRHSDMGALFEAIEKGTPVDEVSLSKLERVVRNGSMPLHSYMMVHWGSALSQAKKEILLGWIRDYRMAHYATAQVDSQFAGEAVRPIPDSLPTNPEKVALGKMLYNDPRLSSDNTVACASCHGLATGGVDNRSHSKGVDGQLGGVNAPTVYNAAFNFEQFWDGRAHTLADQAGGPPLNPVEMASTSWEQIIDKLKADKPFTAMFMKVYPEGYSGTTLTDAIAEYEKTLLTPDSRFDLYLKGDSTALTAQELQGYELFKENGCAMCHVGTLLGGQSFEYMGLKGDYFAARNGKLTDGDDGRFSQTKDESDRHRFKVPGLRNVALTFPYFHDGSRETLEEAVADMATYQSGVTLTADQQAEMVAFLKTLTGKHDGVLLTNTNTATVK